MSVQQFAMSMVLSSFFAQRSKKDAKTIDFIHVYPGFKSGLLFWKPYSGFLLFTTLPHLPGSHYYQSNQSKRVVLFVNIFSLPTRNFLLLHQIHHRRKIHLQTSCRHYWQAYLTLLSQYYSYYSAMMRQNILQ
jgi:hypothetical protein